ncbi:MAG: bifunctional 5,10-methylenetetrahydrofolate dehydrogenase/5,10-methenyltetrahydrofolate cyclohydrolase [Alphaproteobacteria bacterium]|nr:bifunctional 5,10-methylenetetrahydrofolate dehydrogenase/5,10-methenyltetrahydrofolate cyclohydrolase [Alphaproteobacteria bacterium]
MPDTIILNGKELAQELNQTLAETIKNSGVTPLLAVITVGDNPASQVYVRNKRKAAQDVGIQTQEYHLNADTKQESIVALIQELNESEKVNAILLQLPVPEHLNPTVLIEAISPQKDVDGLTSYNAGGLLSGRQLFVPCTPRACLYLLQKALPTLDGLHAVILGRSALVGRPLASLLLQHNCTVTVAHSHSQHMSDILKTADIIISAAGKPGLLHKEDVKVGAAVIDVGINRLSDGKIVGDVLFLEMLNHAGCITPVPGGVGPLTVAMLLQNTWLATQRQKSGHTDIALL